MGFCFHLAAIAALSLLAAIAHGHKSESSFHSGTCLDSSSAEEALSLVQLRAGQVTNLDVTNGTDTPEGSLFVWIMLGRVGSTSMRRILSKRSTRHGFHVVREETDLVRGFTYDPTLCHWSGQLDDPEGVTPPRCTKQPDGSVVTTIYPGYCKKFAGSRPCKYFTLLREPVERMVSEYAHFCASCAENALRCQVQPEEKDFWNTKHPGEPLPNTCPNITLLEYAQRRDNPYTRRFSKVDAHEIMEGAWWVSGYYTEISEKHRKSALETLTANNMLVLWLENLSEREGEKPSGLEMLADYLQDDGLINDAAGIHENPSHGKPDLDEKTLSELENILAWDLKLYSDLQMAQADAFMHRNDASYSSTKAHANNGHAHRHGSGHGRGHKHHGQNRVEGESQAKAPAAAAQGATSVTTEARGVHGFDADSQAAASTDGAVQDQSRSATQSMQDAAEAAWGYLTGRKAKEQVDDNLDMQDQAATAQVDEAHDLMKTRANKKNPSGDMKGH